MNPKITNGTGQTNITFESGQSDEDDQCAKPDHIGQAIRLLFLLFALLILIAGVLGLILILVREL